MTVVSYLEAGPRDAVETQRLLDAHYEQSMREWLKRGIPFEPRPLSYRLSVFELSARTVMQFRREARLKLVLLPLSLSVELRHEIAATSVLHLTAEIHAAPPHEGPL